MRKELFKKSFVRYHSTKFKDSSLINSNPIFDGTHPVFVTDFVYTDEKTFVDNFANQLFCVHREHAFIIVEENGDKISFKVFSGSKNRREGRTWFKVSKRLDYLTVNRLTGDVYRGYITDYHKKRKFKKAVRRNFFLNEPLSSILVTSKNLITNFSNHSGEVIDEAAEIFINSIVQSESNLSREQRLLKFYFDKKKFKYPNNFHVFVETLHDKIFKKFLKKNSNKIVDAFMQSNELRGKKIKKALHQIKHLNIGLYKVALDLFGENWLNQEEDFIREILESTISFSNFYNPAFKNLVTQAELRNTFKVFKSVINIGEINSYSFFDHLRMFVQLKEFGDNQVRWESDGSDWNQFHQEHLSWTDKLEHFQKGTYNRIYPKYFYDEIQQKIDSYIPILLKNSHEYNEESQSQSNCVKGYIGKVSSLIISLRKDDFNSKERATLEYQVIKIDEEIKVKRVQSLGRYNSELNETWNDVLLKLDKKVLSCFNREDFESVKLEKECSNGVQLTSDSHFNQDGFLQWSYKPIIKELW